MNVLSIKITRAADTDGLVTIEAKNAENGQKFQADYKANQLNYLQFNSNRDSEGNNDPLFSLSINQQVFNGNIVKSGVGSLVTIVNKNGTFTPLNEGEMRQALQPVFLDASTGGGGGGVTLQQAIDNGNVFDKDNEINADSFQLLIQRLSIFALYSIYLDEGARSFFEINADGELILTGYSGSADRVFTVKLFDGASDFEAYKIREVSGKHIFSNKLPDDEREVLKIENFATKLFSSLWLNSKNISDSLYIVQKDDCFITLSDEQTIRLNEDNTSGKILIIKNGSRTSMYDDGFYLPVDTNNVGVKIIPPFCVDTLITDSSGQWNIISRSINYVQSKIKGFITQTGTNDPVLNIIENTTGTTFSASYDDTGKYVLIAATAGNLTGMDVFYQFNPTVAFSNIKCQRLGALTVRITTQISGASANDVLQNTPLEIMFI